MKKDRKVDEQNGENERRVKSNFTILDLILDKETFTCATFDVTEGF